MATLIKRNKISLPTLVNDLFDNNFFDFDGDLMKAGTKLTPSVNVTETEKDFKIEVAVPGMEKKDLKVDVDKGIITISGEKSEESKEEKKNYTRREFSYNKFSRAFQLPDNCLAEKITANYDQGMLSITLPKKEVAASNPKKEIKVS